MVYIIFIMEINMQVYFHKAKGMEKESISGLMVHIMMENGNKIRCQDMVLI